MGESSQFMTHLFIVVLNVEDSKNSSFRIFIFVGKCIL